MLRGLAELFLNDLSATEKPEAMHLRCASLILQMNRALGMFEAQSKLWCAAGLLVKLLVKELVTNGRRRRIVREERQHIFWFHRVDQPVISCGEVAGWRSIWRSPPPPASVGVR